MPPEICPNCGAEVPLRARACPECGADEQTGWSEDEEFDYDEFVKEEFGPKDRIRPTGVSWIWWVTALILLAALAAWLLGS